MTTQEMPKTDGAAPVVHLAELALFTRQLGSLLEAGVEVLRALEVAAQQAGNPRLVRAARRVAALMADGREFGEAASHFPDIFSPFYLQMVRQGEADGVLGRALLALADYLDQELLRQPGASGGGASAPMIALALLLVLGVAAAGAALLVGLGSLYDWQQWTLPATLGWCGVVLLAGAAWIGWHSKSAPRPCASCGRPMPPSRGWKQRARLCEACIQLQVARLKPPERAREEAAAFTAGYLATDLDGLDDLADLERPEPAPARSEEPGDGRIRL